MTLQRLLPNTLKFRMSLITVLIFVVSLWSMTYYASALLRQDMQRELGEQQFLSVSLIAAHLDEELVDRMRALETIAGEITPAVMRDRAGLQALLEQRPLLQLLFNGGVFATDLKGTAIADVPLAAGRIGTNYIDRDSVAVPLQQGKSVYGRPAMGKKLMAPIFSMTFPVRDAQGHVSGALVGTINLGKPNFFDNVVNRRYGTGGGYYLIAREHRLFVTASDKKRVMQALPARGVNRFIDEAMDGYEGYGVVTGSSGVESLSAVSRVPSANWLVTAALPTDEAFRPIRHMQERMLEAAVILTLLAGFIVWSISSWLLRRQLLPVLTVSKALTSLPDLARSVNMLPVVREDEIGQMISGFNRLLQINLQREEVLKDSEAFGRSILDSVDAEIAVINHEGVILRVNEPWHRFALDNGVESEQGMARLEVGADYLAVCQASDAAGESDASSVREGIRAVLSGDLNKFTTEYPCHNAHQQRWFALTVTPLRDGEGRGAVIAHADISERKRYEQTVLEQRRDLLLLSQASQRLNRTLDIDEIYLTINEFMSEICANDSFSISAFDPATQMITCRAYVMDKRLLDVSTFPPIALEEEGRGTQSMVIRSGASLLVNDFQARLKNTQTSYLVDGQTHRIFPAAETDDDVVRSALLVPLKATGTVTGVMQVMSCRRDAFTEDHLKLLEALALHVASAEQNARLFLQVQAELDERRRAQKALGASETRYRTAFQTSPDAFAIMGLEDAVLLDVNEGFCQLLGWTRAEVLGKRSQDIHVWRNDDDRETVARLLTRDGQCVNFESEFVARNGSVVTGLLSAQLMTLDGVQCVFSVTRDISDRKAAEQKIETLAFSDSLTGLPNRRLLLDRMHQAIASGARHGHHSALLLVDLDDFKTLNDTLGHHQGDMLLQQVAGRLATCVREGDTVARLGGDEFVVMLENLKEDAFDAAVQAETVAEKILAVLNQSYQLENSALFSTPSIGITLFGTKPERVDEPLIRADLAMYQAKAAGRNAMRFFDPRMQIEVAALVAMEAGLRQALRTNQFVLHFQPQVKEGQQITGAEALVRWIDPVRGMVSPGEFIPVAEKTGLILPLGHWVLEAACAQLAAWAQRPEMVHLTVAVNVSARQFRQADFVEEVLDTLARTGARADLLKLELTESVMVVNVEDVIAKMAALKAKGVRFSLDDFGTGYSSLFYLKRMPLDQLKIDQGFVRNILLDRDDAAIAKMVIGLGKSLGLEVIAEGVETHAQRDFLVELGCHAHQGYLYGRPAPVEEFEAIAAQR
ncbi:MAG: EAL domain-containing protein [Comamonadaceae bacterium]